MHIIITFFGEGKELNCLQMCSRSLVIFLFSLGLIRVSGRRSFGVKTPLDNIIVILLGTVLGRAIVGASSFLPVIAASLLIVLLHRIFCWLMINSIKFSTLVDGEKIILFKDGHFIKKNIDKGLVSEEDIMQGVRKSALTDQLDKIEKIYIERNGEVTAIKKNV
ncbi:MAG TPA: YetF domain-containing protein [Ferruginibacter sp.]|nr:YetF domain-containing protein [Ferruginibacter sp.]